MIYCFDLDGTLCTETNGKYEQAQPYKDRINRVNQLYLQGHKILIDTARGTLTGKDHFALTEKQLKEWGVKYHLLITGKKLYADFYIDDKSYNAENFF